MSSTIRLGTCRKDAQYRSTSARPIRSSDRTSGRFSRREMVGCTRDGGLRTQLPVRRRTVERHLEQGIAAQVRRVVAVLVAGRDHQQAKANDVGEGVGDLIGRTWVLDAGGKTIRDTQALLNLTERQDSAIGRQ